MKAPGVRCTLAVTLIERPHHARASKAADADVEAERHHGIKRALGDRQFDRVLDGALVCTRSRAKISSHSTLVMVALA